MQKNTRRVALLLFALALIVCGIAYAKTAAKNTPEYAMTQIQQALRQKDAATLEKYVDFETLVPDSYDTGTQILARDIEHLHALYPDDWFFRHDTAFMTDYIQNRRADDLALIRGALAFYFEPEKRPVTQTDGTAHWLADEARKFDSHYTATVGAIEKDGDAALVTVQLAGDSSDYGRLVPQLTLKLRLAPAADGHYMVKSISNPEEIFYPVVKGIEDYWTLQGWQ